MSRALVACRSADRDRLLRRLHELGVLHIVPAQPRDNRNGHDRDTELKQLDTALQAVSAVAPHGPHPQLDIDTAVREILAIWNGGEAARARLDALYREAEHLRPWGATRVTQLRELASAHVDLAVVVVPEAALPQLRARVLVPLQHLPNHRRLVATVDLDHASLPRATEHIPLPVRDYQQLQAEVSEIEAALERGKRRLCELAWLRQPLEQRHESLLAELEWARASHSGMDDDRVYAVQGWVPTERAATLAPDLTAELAVAVRTTPAQPGDHPPTLVRYHGWSQPIDGLFRMLGMVPGYDELDASTVFMIAVPAFAGMIIGDAGYGLLMILLSLLGRRFLDRTMGRDLRTLLTWFGIAAVAWGAITGVWFGLTPAALTAHGGVSGALGSMLDRLLLIRGSDDETRTLLMQICFLIGTAHLVTARFRRLHALWPDPRAFAELGWAFVLAAMLGLIWLLFFGAPGPHAARLAFATMALGLLLVIAFTHPDRSPAARVGLGFAGSLLPLLSTFGDTLSYIRLMAVGLASFYLGSTFNLLAANTTHATSWVIGALVLLAGHALNIGLTMIAIFAHGVRLNVLEFSSNAGIQWAGYPYRPFADHSGKGSS